MIIIAVSAIIIPQIVMAGSVNSGRTEKPVRLIFVHHSCGENWLSDNNGGLAHALSTNGYFVSDTNYGWGPDSIGDRTDITDWPEWFVGPGSKRYLKALYNENGIHSSYKRILPDPGGENRVIMFKSCFPNSNLKGRPTDQASPENGLTLSNAKAIYNRLLIYFASRPDKLFIVITAPPVQDGMFASNARAFNTWLVRDWLSKYEGKNVAVFDFYNVLTGPGNHHRVHNGKIQHIIHQGKNTLFYPTNGDDHPSPKGNRKATKEFVPLLNMFSQRWLKSGSANLSPGRIPDTIPKSTATDEKSKFVPTKHNRVSPSVPGAGIIDNFENESDEWQAFLEQGKARLQFRRDKGIFHGGAASLHITYNIMAPEGWASCSLVYPSPRNWKTWKGLSLYLHGGRVGQQVVITVYGGNSSDNLSHFEFRAVIDKSGKSGWQRVVIPWNRFIPPPWEGDAGRKFNPGRTMGMAFMFDAPDGEGNQGEVWVDDVNFLSGGIKNTKHK